MIVGITRVRDESLIIADTLQHFFKWCDHIVLYDDVSRDETVEIAHEIGGDRITIIRGDEWRKDRAMENTRHRAIVFDVAKEMGASWVLCFDADERLVGDQSVIKMPTAAGISGYTFRLFDGYLTPDRQKHYKRGNDLAALPRLWGPEYRDILMLFRPEHAR